MNTTAAGRIARRTRRRARWIAAGVAALTGAVAAAPGTAGTQQPAEKGGLPFAIGETLEYRVRLGSLGGGTGSMRVVGQERVRGHQTWELAFDFRARVAIAVVEDRSRSWLDPVRMRSVRYEKRERTPFASHDERVEIFPEQRRWADARGAVRASPGGESLDELSFIYYIRTLDLTPGAAHTFDQHFDPARSPVTVRVRGRERVSVPAGEFATVVVDMEVKDDRRYGGRGVIRFHITDDRHRIPVRIESSIPVVGTATLSLQRWTPGA